MIEKWIWREKEDGTKQFWKYKLGKKIIRAWSDSSMHALTRSKEIKFSFLPFKEVLWGNFSFHLKDTRKMGQKHTTVKS